MSEPPGPRDHSPQPEAPLQPGPPQPPPSGGHRPPSGESEYRQGPQPRSEYDQRRSPQVEYDQGRPPQAEYDQGLRPRPNIRMSRSTGPNTTSAARPNPDIREDRSPRSNISSVPSPRPDIGSSSSRDTSSNPPTDLGSPTPCTEPARKRPATPKPHWPPEWSSVRSTPNTSQRVSPSGLSSWPPFGRGSCVMRPRSQTRPVVVISLVGYGSSSSASSRSRSAYRSQPLPPPTPIRVCLAWQSPGWASSVSMPSTPEPTDHGSRSPRLNLRTLRWVCGARGRRADRLTAISLCSGIG